MERPDRHAGALPWGWWLRANGGVLEDEEGQNWDSVRDAFWCGELGFPGTHLVAEQLELLTRVLTSIDARWQAGDEHERDLFGGDHMFWRFYRCWLASIGMLEPGGAIRLVAHPLDAPLSPEGRSVMLMLQATRDPEWERLPMADIVDAVKAAGRGDADGAREDALQAFERSLGRRRQVFARERVGRSHLITLTGITADARMPTRRVAWSMAFADERTRDNLFAWLAERVDRWDDWGRMAHENGADEFTRCLLKFVTSSALST